MKMPIHHIRPYIEGIERRRAWAILDGRTKDIEFLTKLIDEATRELEAYEKSL